MVIEKAAVPNSCAGLNPTTRIALWLEIALLKPSMHPEGSRERPGHQATPTMSSGQPRRSSGAIFDICAICFGVLPLKNRSVTVGRSHSVHGHTATAEFLDEDIVQSFDRPLRAGVECVTARSTVGNRLGSSVYANPRREIHFEPLRL